MKTIIGVSLLGIASLSLFVLILGLGFQNSLGNVFGGVFDQFGSGQDILLTFVYPLVPVLGFAVLVLSLLRIFD